MRLEVTKRAFGEKSLCFLPCLPEERPHEGLEFQVLRVGCLSRCADTVLDEAALRVS